MTADCNICKRPLDDPKDPDLTQDCGGDCFACMAKIGDPDCEAAVARIMAGDPCDDWSADGRPLSALTDAASGRITELSPTEDPT